MWQDEGGFLRKALFSLKKLHGTLFVMRWAPGTRGCGLPLQFYDMKENRKFEGHITCNWDNYKQYFHFQGFILINRNLEQQVLRMFFRNLRDPKNLYNL